MGKKKDVFVRRHVDEDFYEAFVVVDDKAERKSLKEMRKKIYQAAVGWNYHVVLTFNEPSLARELAKGGVDASWVSNFFTKLRNMDDVKLNHYFWKYEEGRKSERPHYHLMLDMDDMSDTKLFKKILGHRENFPKYDAFKRANMRKMIQKARRYKMNWGKTDNEILLGLFLNQRWKRGIVFARRIKNQRDKVHYVEKDINKTSGSKYKRKRAWNYAFSRGIPKDPSKQDEYYEDVGVMGQTEAIHHLLLTKEEYERFYEEQGTDGERKFWRMVRNIKRGWYRP